MFTTIILILTLAGPLFSLMKSRREGRLGPPEPEGEKRPAVGVQMGSKLKGPSTDLDAELVSRG
jgi:hypothetical protein